MEKKLFRKRSSLTSSRAAQLFLFLIAIWSNAAALADTEVPASNPQESTTWQLIQNKLRMRTFSEFMTPGFSNNPTQIPDNDGNATNPTNLFNIAWVDYEVATNTRILYWQRFTVNFAQSGSASGVSAIARNPRFAFRRTNLFNNPNINSTYDLYIQPGLAPEATAAGRSFEFGFRTNTSYEPSDSRLSFGMVTEFTFSPSSQVLKEGSTRADVYGWAMPWASYKLNKLFATQHFLTVNFKHNQGKAWYGFELDDYFPYIQNGIGVNVTEKVWAAVFVNNYLISTPTLQNTWASMWLSMSVL